MERYLLVGLIAADIFYVVPTLTGELLSLLLWKRIDRFERRLHAISDDRYFAVFTTPVLAFVGGLGGGISTSMIGEGAGASVLGFVLSALIVFGVARHQYGEATGRRPRPVPRARWRQRAAELSRLLSDGVAPAGRERHRLRRRVAALGEIGSRITAGVRGRTWRDAFRSESRTSRALIVTSFILPVGVSLWASVRFGVTGNTFVGHVIMLTLAIAAATTPLLRWVRTRNSLLALGHELSVQSHDLLRILSQAALPRPRPPRLRPAGASRHSVRRHARSA
ncbi:hypothetical protein [Streptomyces flavofungini]|uniref:Uncharacterized protein n=1 Tax=Streptomyces flavofungini TaxID=68200 RepID=A0ABS0X1M2_9ACTN|nr:hypothetical protein [Streptomyces flavofungini]MBJ3807084.1 hypothetical protein [Streptomyces flavofungini]